MSDAGQTKFRGRSCAGAVGSVVRIGRVLIGMELLGCLDTRIVFNQGRPTSLPSMLARSWQPISCAGLLSYAAHLHCAGRSHSASVVGAAEVIRIPGRLAVRCSWLIERRIKVRSEVR